MFPKQAVEQAASLTGCRVVSGRWRWMERADRRWNLRLRMDCGHQEFNFTFTLTRGAVHQLLPVVLGEMGRQESDSCKSQTALDESSQQRKGIGGRPLAASICLYAACSERSSARVQ